MRFVLLASLSALTCSAQFAPSVRAGISEVGLYGGASYGADSFRPMFGVNYSYSVNRFLLPYVEFSLFPELLRVKETQANRIEGTARLIDFHGGIHIRAARPESRFVPYAVLGFGVLSSDIKTTNTDKASKVRNVGNPITASDPAINFGAGLRHYSTERFGVRAEYKVYRPMSGAFESFFSKVEGGIFFQF